MAVTIDPGAFGIELRRWRRQRRFSQLELSNRAAVSQRHLSFLETGRSRPSPEMIEHLSIVLDVPVRQRGELFRAAGFATPYSAEPLDSPVLAEIRSGLDALVEAHHPFPAFVVDRCWNLLLANRATAAITDLLVPPAVAADLGGNVLRLLLHPDGIRPAVSNWADVATMLLHRVGAELDHDPGDEALLALVDEIMAYPGVGDLRAPTRPPADFLAEVRLSVAGTEFRLYTAISSLAAARDVTLDELRLETLLPADAASADALRQLVPSDP